MHVTAFSTAARPEWRWRICDYGGETIEDHTTVSDNRRRRG